MGLWTRKTRGSMTSGGLFIFGGIMQYLVLSRLRDNTFRLEECINAPYDIGESSGELFADQQKIEENLKSLKRDVGKRWAGTVHAGIQSKDVLLRMVELPKMGLEDMKNSLRFEFDKYFPIPVNDSIYDLALIDYPSREDLPKDSNTQCLATAMRRQFVENFMFAANKVGLKLASIEPAPVSMLRSLMGPDLPSGYNIFALVGILSSMIVATYKDNGVIFRNTTQAFASDENFSDSVSFFASDLQSTIAFATSQMRTFGAEKIYLGGYGASRGDEFSREIARISSSPVGIINPWELWEIPNPPSRLFGWEIALGLALRSMVAD